MTQAELPQPIVKDKVYVPQPEPGLTPEALVARARDLQPLLRAQQDEADQRGSYSDEVHELFRKAGFYRTLQPKMFGGYEFGFPTFLKLIIEISRGHPGTAWCFTLAASHALVVGSHFPEEVQREIFGPEGEFRAPHRSAPAGTFTRTDGGYIVNGSWSYSSGVPVCTHFMGGGAIIKEDGSAIGINFIVPRENIVIVPDWGGGISLGMEGSGSHTVKLNDVFVPDRHILSEDVLIGSPKLARDGSPGARLHHNPMYLGIVGGAYQSTFSAIFVGAARAALDEFEEVARTTIAFRRDGVKRYEDIESQIPFGAALNTTDCAEAITIDIAEKFMEQCRRWERDRTPLTPEDTMQLWGMSRRACQMACEAIETLFHASPVRAANKGQKMQRYFRDAQMYRIHPSAQLWVDHTRARAHFGLPLERFGH